MTWLETFFSFPAVLLEKFIELFFMEEENLNGARIDPRSVDQKQLDYTYDEMLGGSTGVVWTPKTDWIKLSIRNQSTSSSCGGQAGSKIIESFTGVISSANPIYRNRSNYSDPGMYLQEIGGLLKIKGTTSEVLSPSQNMTELQMNEVTVPIDLPYAISAYYILPMDVDVIASAMNIGHGVIFLIHSSYPEWIDVPVVTQNPITFGHFVASIAGNYTLYNGEKAFIIDDSCNLSTTLNKSGQRILTESFLQARCAGVLGIIPNRGGFMSIPQCTISKELSYGMMHDTDVKNLQDMLKVQQVLDWSVPSTGNFLNATKAAVMKFQQKYASDILTPLGLTEPTGYVGKGTIAKLKSLFP